MTVHSGTHWQIFRRLPFIPYSTLVKLQHRKEKDRFPEESGELSGKRQK
jgi:hypothetical protein